MYEDTDYDALERNVKYIPWKGNKEEWYTWHKTFLVRAMTRGYHGILVGLESVPSDEDAKTFAGLTEMTSAQKKKFNNYKLNIRAYVDLLQCCTQDIISFGMVDAAKDKELSNGNAKLAWKHLSEKFAGHNNAEKMKLIKQLNESRMGKKEDPDEWITNLERLKQRIAECGKTIDNNELVMHILYHLPTEYDTINDKYLKDLDDRNDVDLEDLRADLRRKHDSLVDSGRIEKNNEDRNDKLVKEERALKTGFKKQFKGKCRVCGKIGHKGTDCWTLDSNKEKRPTRYNDKNDGNKNYKFNGNCNYCDKKGHKEADCRAKQRRRFCYFFFRMPQFFV